MRTIRYIPLRSPGPRQEDVPLILVRGNVAGHPSIANGGTNVSAALGTDFGAQYLTGGATSRTFIVTNAGNSTLNLAAVALGGDHPGDFEVTTYPATVAPSNRGNIVVKFDPAATGLRRATVQIASDAAAEIPTSLPSVAPACPTNRRSRCGA